MYLKYKEAKLKIPLNAFQNLDVGGDLWNEVLNEA
jgi:hypothetical protein